MWQTVWERLPVLGMFVGATVMFGLMVLHEARRINVVTSDTWRAVFFAGMATMFLSCLAGLMSI